MTKYKIGNDGFVMIDTPLRKKTQKWNESGNVIDPLFISLVNKKKLTNEYLYDKVKSIIYNKNNKVTQIINNKNNELTLSVTSILRAANYNKYLKRRLRKLSLRPLPIKKYISKNKKECNLYSHQLDAMLFLRKRKMMSGKPDVYSLRGCILKMTMGLGKTLTAISYCLTSPRPKCDEKYGENGFPSLIIASKTVMLEWKCQGFDKFFGAQVKVLYLHKDFINGRIHTITRKDIVKYDFVVTTYDVCVTVCNKTHIHEQVYVMGDDHTMMKDKIEYIRNRTRRESNRPNMKGAGVIYGTPWENVIVDESQRFANPKTKTFKYMMAIYGRFKICLTGTPIRNYATDIWAQLRWCGYSGILKAKEWDELGLFKMRGHNLVDAILTVEYNDVDISLPLKHEIDIYVELDKKEKHCYDIVLGIAGEQYDEMMRGGCSFASVLALFTRLRQSCIAAYLITNESKRKKGGKKVNEKKEKMNKAIAPVYKILGDWVSNPLDTSGIKSKKISKILDVLKKIPKGEKVLVFSMFTSVLDLIVKACNIGYLSFEYVQVDGDTKGLDREYRIHKFRTNKSIQGMFMTYKVGSEGLNLIEAQHVICAEPWWTNAVHNQAKARCWRNGQNHEVYVYNIYVKDTIEDRIVEICKKKDDMTKAMLSGTLTRSQVRLDKRTMGKILGRLDYDLDGGTQVI